MRISRYISLFLSLPVLLIGCAKEVQDDPMPEVTDTIPFSVTVQADPVTRASFDGSALGSGNYVFAAGDKIYITGHNGDISGELTLASGVGTGTATFGGSLEIINNFEPTAETILSATLVGASQVGTVFTVTDGKITAGPTYPSSIAYTSSLADLVQQFSHFTASFTYNVRSFTLTQQTVFLDFALELYRSSLDISGESPTVQVDIKSSDGNTTLRSVSGVPVTGSSVLANITFTTVFPAGTALQSAQTWVENGNDDIHFEPDFASDLDLSANNYYHVTRSTIEDFTVEAPANGQGASVTFNYGYDTIEYRIYTGGAWTNWESYSSTISLTAGQKVSFRGQGSSYANTTGSIGGKDNATLTQGTPLITFTNSVNIYGDIMSLMCDSNWSRHPSVGANAFKFAFSGCTNINIPADKDLVLSAETLGNSCYEGMFSGCTNLTKVPVLPVNTTIPDRAYYGMFRQCTKLETPPESLLATALGKEAYSQMFYGCTKLKSVPSFPSTPVTWNGKDVCFKMFFQCKDNLTTLTGQLFSGTTTMGQGCFMDMFSECSKLATVPSDYLPATTLAVDCYRGMFQSTKITRAPDLLVEDISGCDNCYRYMYYNCKSLNYIKCLARDPWPSPNPVPSTSAPYTQNWVQNVTTGDSNRTFIRNNNDQMITNWPTGNHGTPSGWTVKQLSEENS